MDVSIIIVNWNSKDFLGPCLDSVFRETGGIEFEVIVIDSGSFDGCGEFLAANYPAVKFIQSEENLGFARANNRAFEASCGESILFLNPDTELQGPAINLLHAALRDLPDAGVLGGCLLNSDGSIQTSCIKPFPSILGEALNAEVLRRRFPRSRLYGMEALFLKGERPSKVDVVSGACLMIDRGLFEEVGRFSEDYFMYSEDVDLCFQVRKAGRENFYIPAARVTHHGGGSSEQSAVNTFSSVMMLEARWKYFRKTRSLGYGLLYRVTVSVMSLVRITLSLVCLLPACVSTRRGRWVKALRKWWASFRWTLGLERWASTYEG